MALQFKKATKTQARLRMAICGPGGSGKTYTSLLVARELANGGRVALIDSERGSASKYADIYDFDVLELGSFSPETYVEAIAAAEASGYAVVVIDSLSHAWAGRDGALEQVDRVVARNEAQNRRANSFTAWREVTPMHNRLVDAMLGSACHIIVTLRVKSEYVVDVDDRGRTAPRKIGLAPIQRDGLEYEFDVIADMTTKNELAVGKTRCSRLQGYVATKPGADFAAIIKSWLSDGAPLPPPQPKTEPSVDHPGSPAGTPAEIPERKELRERIAAWSKTTGDDFRTACGMVLRAAGIEAPPKGGQLADPEVVAALAWVKEREGMDFVAATAPRPPEPRRWEKPGRITRTTVWYWREKLRSLAEAWISGNAAAAGKSMAEELVRQLEVDRKLPGPTGDNEKSAATAYAAVTDKPIDWAALVIPF